MSIKIAVATAAVLLGLAGGYVLTTTVNVTVVSPPAQQQAQEDNWEKIVRTPETPWLSERGL